MKSYLFLALRENDQLDRLVEAGKIVPLVFSDNDLKTSGLYHNEVKQFKSLNESKDSGREFPELEGLSEDEVFKLLSSVIRSINQDVVEMKEAVTETISLWEKNKEGKDSEHT